MLSEVVEETTESSGDALREHVEHCTVCQARLERLRWMAPGVRKIARTGSDPGEHPTELQLAQFAEGTCDSQLADEIIGHLAQCHSCRETVSATRRLIS